MSRRFVVLCLASLALWASSPAFALPTSDEVLKMMAEKEATVKTMQGDSATTVSTPMGQMKGAGQVFTAKSEVDGKPVQKMLMTLKSTVQAEDTTVTTDIKIVNDGQFVWQEMRTPMAPAVQVIKMRVGQLSGMQGPGAVAAQRVEQLKSQFDFKGVAEDTIDGRKMYVLEGTAKPDQPRAILLSKVKYYLDQEQMLFRRMVAYDKEGNEFSRFDLTNVKINEEIDPKLFEYTPPAGARVVDRTQDAAGK